MKYLTSCANFFRSGEVDVYQFKCGRFERVTTLRL